MENFRIEIDADGFATVWFDVPARTMNTFTNGAVADLEALAAEIRDNDAIKGVILASGKDNAFCAGADLGDLAERAGMHTEGIARVEALDATSRMSRALRAIETAGKPVVAALEGLALGGGFEFVLAAHRRVASTKASVGLPEVTIGLLPGAGGTQRTVRLAGVQPALDLMLSGAPIDAVKAHKLGLIDELVEPGRAIDGARVWLRAGGQGMQPWDVKGYSMPDGPNSPSGAGTFMVAAGAIHARSYGNYPAQLNIARCVYEGFALPMDAALRVESRLFLATLETPQARAMIRSIFLSKQALAKGSSRPAEVAPSRVMKAAVLGAGMMGAGIAYAQAKAGIDTILIDVSKDAAEKGKAYAQSVVDKAVARGAMSRDAAAALVGRITATDDYTAIAGADLVVEAVFEDRELKAEVTRKAETVLGETGIMGSNTSTLPISSLAEASKRPANFIGLHFFSPVDRMELVEIIVGRETSRETLARAIDYCRQLKKVPIVVNDSRGFYTSRVFETYITEGLELLLEGVAPAIIDNVGRMTGMPRGPLELLDDVAIDLLDKIFKQRRADLQQPEPSGGPAKLLLDLVAMGRYGRKNGRGIYDYPAGGQKRLWAGLADLAPVKVARSTPELKKRIRLRLLFRQAIEAARCMDENVVTSPRDADVGAFLGWGFAGWTGGPMSLIDRVGLRRFVETCDEFAVTDGPRFQPPRLLVNMARENRCFYPSEASVSIPEKIDA